MASPLGINTLKFVVPWHLYGTSKVSDSNAQGVVKIKRCTDYRVQQRLPSKPIDLSDFHALTHRRCTTKKRTTRPLPRRRVYFQGVIADSMRVRKHLKRLTTLQLVGSILVRQQYVGCLEFAIKTSRKILRVRSLIRSQGCSTLHCNLRSPVSRRHHGRLPSG